MQAPSSSSRRAFGGGSGYFEFNGLEGIKEGRRAFVVDDDTTLDQLEECDVLRAI